MKITDLALIFIIILFPIVMIVFVNTSFVLKSEKQELYYKEVIRSAIEDSVKAMKRVENTNLNIDYGYSSIADNKVSINADIAISTFKNSLFNTFNIKGNTGSEQALMTYIPVIAIFDYDGIYIHSAEKSSDGTSYSFVTKPKRSYSYSYVIAEKEGVLSGRKEYSVKEYGTLEFDERITDNLVYTVNFTLDNYITLYVSKIEGGQLSLKNTLSFYLDDTSKVGYFINQITSIAMTETYTDSGGNEKNVRVHLYTTVLALLKNVKKEVIAKTCMQEMVYAANLHNKYAEMAGVKYNFEFSVESDDRWYETVSSIGMFALVQGISLGNRYLNYNAYGISDLSLVKEYYLSNALDKNAYKDVPEYYHDNLYHKSINCRVYLDAKSLGSIKSVVNHFTSKQEAATNGYHPCPICKP